MSEALSAALALLIGLDSKLVEIVLLSLRVSLSAVAISALLGLPVGAAIAVGRFPGRQTVIVLLNALMGLPPVVVGQHDHRSEEHTSELQSHSDLVCRLLLEKKKNNKKKQCT